MLDFSFSGFEEGFVQWRSTHESWSVVSRSSDTISQDPLNTASWSFPAQKWVLMGLIQRWWHWWRFLPLVRVTSRWFQATRVSVGIRGRTQSHEPRRQCPIVFSDTLRERQTGVSGFGRSVRSHVWLFRATSGIWVDLNFLLPLGDTVLVRS